MRDDPVLAELLPHGYKIHHRARSSRGGGVALIYKDDIEVEMKPQLQTPIRSFEYIECALNTSPPLRIVVIYRPPSSQKDAFFGEFGDLLEHLVMTNGQLLITGDFNLHIDSAECPITREFCALIHSYGLDQHVDVPTHGSGHTLDLLMTLRIDDPLTVTVCDLTLSDHYALQCSLRLGTSKKSLQPVTFRSLKKIDATRFTNDLRRAFTQTLTDSVGCHMDRALVQYNTALKNVLDEHAPVKKKMMPPRPNAPWYTDELRELKQKKRRCERRWLKSGLEVHRLTLVEMRRQLNASTKRTKSSYFNNLIGSHSTNPKAMFNIVSGLLGKQKKHTLPPHASDQRLADKFSEFFITKIEAIKDSISSSNVPPDQHPVSDSSVSCSLTSWSRMDQEEVRKIIMKSPSKHCSMDPVPTWLLKNSLDPVLPMITAIFNQSLESGEVPKSMKNALITPLLKKPKLDSTDISNYRPVSNLSFLSKVLERVVDAQLSRYLTENGLHEKLQSAYRKNHSTETALIRVQNDIMLAFGEKKVCLLLLLDLSAAFDTVEHAALLKTMEKLGISCVPLQWFRSYLEGRMQQVKINDSLSDPQPLTSGVPQGSVLGPVLFNIYTASLGRLIQSHGLSYHLYADDTSLYLTFEADETDNAVARIEHCAEAVREWMGRKQLKMNPRKTELLLLASKSIGRRIPAMTPTIHIDDTDVTPADAVRYIGVLFDKNMRMDGYIDSVCRSARHHLFNIGRIRHLLTREACEQLIHAFVVSKLDYGNALMYGLPQKQLQKLQRIQNAAARIITYTGLRQHITPVLIDLHWLPITSRIRFKIALLVYKCLNDAGPAYLTDLLETQSDRIDRSLRSADQHHMLQVPRPRCSSDDRAFQYHAPAIWNALPDSLRVASSLTDFKSKLKTFLFRDSYFN